MYTCSFQAQTWRATHNQDKRQGQSPDTLEPRGEQALHWLNGLRRKTPGSTLVTTKNTETVSDECARLVEVLTQGVRRGT